MARRLIRQRLQTSKIASALGIYDALTEIASNKESDTFEATQSYIGLYTGVSGKTVQRIGPDLERLDLIAIKENHIGGRNAKCTYTLLSLGHYVRTPGHGRKQPCCLTIEEHKKNPQKNVVEQIAPNQTPQVSTTTNFDDLIREVQKEYPQHNVQSEANNAQKYYAKLGKALTRSMFLAWMKRAEPPLKRAKPVKQAASKAQPVGWLEWVGKTYPAARVRDYWKVSGDVQREFEAVMATRAA